MAEWPGEPFSPADRGSEVKRFISSTVTTAFVRSQIEDLTPLLFRQTDWIEWRRFSRARPSQDGKPLPQPLTIHRSAPYTQRARSPRTLLFLLCESAAQSLQTPHRWQLQDVPQFLRDSALRTSGNPASLGFNLGS